MLATTDSSLLGLGRPIGSFGHGGPCAILTALPKDELKLRPVPPNNVLFWQDEDQPHDVAVVEGVVRAVRLWNNGGRHILTFFWPGDVIRSAPRQRYTAETVTRCVVRRCRDGERGEDLRDASGTDQVLQASIQLIGAIGKTGAVSRVAWFLLRMRDHLPADPKRPDALRFTIPRTDVADHLGLSVETVCRTLSEFRAKGLIDLPDRKTIRFRDVARLGRIARACEAALI